MLYFKHDKVPESTSGIILSDLQISCHTNFIGIFPKYASDTKLSRVSKISLLQVFAEWGKTAYEIIIDVELYWKWIPSHVLFKDFPNNFSNILWFFVDWKETDFMKLFLITSLKHVATMIFDKYLKWLLTSVNTAKFHNLMYCVSSVQGSSKDLKCYF